MLRSIRLALTLCLCLGLLLRPNTFASAQDDSVPWINGQSIEAFAGRFSYDAYAGGVVIYDNTAKTQETVRVTGRTAVGATFRQVLAEDKEAANKLGVALSAEVSVLKGKLQVQVFRNGMMIYEPASRTIWWCWHSQSRKVDAPKAPGSGSAPTAPAPKVPKKVPSDNVSTAPKSSPSPPVAQRISAGAIIDETGTLSPQDVQNLLAALRTLQTQYNVALGIVILNPTAQADGENKAQTYRHQMIANNALPQQSAVLAIRNKNSYTWQSDARVMSIVTAEKIRYAWTLTDSNGSYSEIARQFIIHLSQLLGGGKPPAPSTPTTPTIPSTPEPDRPETDNSPATPVSPPVAPVGSGIPLPAAVQPGPVVVQKRIGPGGGNIAVPGEVLVDFPAGALKSEETIAIRRAQGSSRDGRFFFIEREGGHSLLARPARISFTLPANVAPGSVLAAQEVCDDFWMICPSSYDSNSRIFTTEVSHFFGFGWFNKDNCIKTVGAAVTAVGTIIVWGAAAGAGIVAWPAAVGVGVGAVIFSAAGVGAAAANPVYETYQRMGLDGVLTVGVEPKATDFVVRWRVQDYAGDSLVVTVAADDQGRMIYSAPGRYSKDQLFAALAGKGFQSASIANSINNVQVVPRKIWVLVWALLQTKAYYRQNGYKPPGTVEVLVDNNLSKSKSNEAHLGEWDDKFLRVHSRLVAGLAPDNASLLEGARDELLATVAHEYWHVIYFAKNYRDTSPYSWLDESMATALESEVGRSYEKSFSMYQAATVAPQFERGLLNFSDQYCAWPFCKYLMHKKDGGYLTDMALGKFDAVALGGVDGVFAGFVRSLLIAEAALPDPMATQNGVSVRTGWHSIEPSDWVAAQAGAKSKGFLEFGVTALQDPPPLSYVLRRVIVNGAEPKDAKPDWLIVRRKTLDAHELFLALKPQFAGGGQARVGGRRALSDTVQGLGGVAVPPSWLEQPRSMVPVAWVNTTARTGSSDPLWTYLLRPPAQIKGAPASGNITLRWQAPEPGAGLKPTDCLRGYRVFYKTKDGKEVMIPDLLIRPDTTAVTVLASAMPGFTGVGLASEDGAMLDGRGEPLRSSIGWLESGTGAVSVRVTEPKPDDLGSYSPMEVLGGKPLPNVPVSCDYTDKGKPVHREATTNARGECRFADIPLDIEVKITARGLSRMVTCTAQKPSAFAPFGWQGHEVTKE